jgi:hypothetical protein
MADLHGVYHVIEWVWSGDDLAVLDSQDFRPDWSVKIAAGVFASPVGAGASEAAGTLLVRGRRAFAKREYRQSQYSSPELAIATDGVGNRHSMPG